MAVDHNLRVPEARLEAVDELLGRSPRGNTVERELRLHALVPVAPTEEGHGVGEDLLSAHGDQPLADFLVLRPHGGRRHCAGVGILPGALRAKLALHDVLRRTCQRQQAERFELQQLAELQERGARGREVRRVQEHGVPGLELGAVNLEERVRTDNRGREANLLWRELLQDLRRNLLKVILAADQQRARSPDRPLGRELGGLRQHQDGVLLLEVLAAGAGLLDTTDAGHADANAGLVQLSPNH
mmetsp:Transcript_51103/g.141538  ORF Transcript_51103/g.141538 Transcript_51103/m.141538 type:complete len:243 (+) Transcript_51103:1312-2040(+)